MEFRTVFGIVLFVFCFFCVDKVFGGKKLIVVLVDGVRWDYLKDPKLKGFRRMMENGVKAPYVNPIFPSLSYPNWYSLATGLYAENHGFVNNLMYENETDSAFRMIPEPGATATHWWKEAEPIWITAEKNNRPAALYWWGGCEVEIHENHPTICERHRYGPPSEEEKLDFIERIEDIVQMFKPSKRFPSDRLSLALMYYGSVDYTGHYSGVTSSNVRQAMSDIDDILDKMQSKLKKAGLQNEVNIMVVSDHGMTDVSEKTTKHISLEKFSSKIKYQAGYGAEMMILPEPGMLDKLYDEIKSDIKEGILIYKKEDIPEKYHVKHNKRMLPLFLIAKKGYFLKALDDSTKRVGGPPKSYLGHHGYDPEETEDMRTIFLATGPAFRRRFTTDVLSNTDLYNVMCNILEIPPLPNNGSLERVKHMLIEHDSQHLRISKASAVESHQLKILFMAAVSVAFSVITSRMF